MGASGRSARKRPKGRTAGRSGAPTEAWLGLLPADPRPWLLSCDEPSARWLTLSELVDGPVDEVALARAHRDVLDDPGTQALLDRLPGWDDPAGFSGHNSPAFAPNLLNLLADVGVAGGDDARIERLLDAMLEHQRGDGRFPSYGSYPRSAPPVWGVLPCDTHAITEVLVRFGRAGDGRVQRAAARIEADLAETDQGPGWLCRPDPAVGFRGPGRKGDVCPQVTLEALRVLARLGRVTPSGATAARTALTVWRQRARHRPYMFGHGRRFRTIKWPTFWYDVHAVLDTLTRIPELWSGDGARPEDRTALAELAACMIAANVDEHGVVTPRSCYRGFEAFSFGQKKRPSPFATARVAVVLRRLGDLAETVAAIDTGAIDTAAIDTGAIDT